MNTIISSITNFVTSQITGIDGTGTMDLYEFMYYMTKYQLVENCVTNTLFWLTMIMIVFATYLIIHHIKTKMED